MTNLPVRATSFVGRDALVQEIAKTLTDARVVTLIGVGGVGKTSVALRVAEELIPEFPDGVWLMELGSVTNGESLPDVLARILNVQQAPGRSMLQTLIDVLRAKRVLLVLDNCEHLLRDCAELAEAFVHACPDLRILATSREGLAIEGEYSRPIPSLGVPDEGAPLDELVTVDAVRLFVDRARAGRPDFEIVSDDAPAVIELCRRLDGVPLALELAAARVRSMSVGEIAARLGERFRLLKGGRRTATERHQTLRGTVDWSYDLLGETERLMFDRLAVFVGGFRLEAAEAVCAADDLDIYDIPDLIADLVDKSMLIATTSSEGHTRYEMLETLRSYGLERLEARGESDSHRRRFAEYYADLVERVGEGVRGPEEGRYVRLTFEEWDNFRSAHQWTVDAGDVDTGLRLVVGLAPFAYDRLTNEAGRWALAASEVPGARDHPLFAEARGEVSIIESQIGELRRAEELVSDLPEGSPTWIKKNTFGIVALYEGRLEDSIAYVADGIEETEAAGDHYNASYFRLCSALAKSYAGRDREEIDIDVAAMERHAEVLGNPRAFAWLAYVRGEVLVEADPEAAVPHLEQAIALAAEAENRFVQSVSRVSLASIRGRHGDPRTALETFGVIISDWRRSGNWIHQWTAVRNLVELFDRLGRVRPAVVLYGASEASETSAPLFGAHRERLDAVVERAKHALGEAEYDAMYRRGCEMPDDEALMFALEEIDSALAELGEG